MNIKQWKSRKSQGKASWCVQHDGHQKFFKTKLDAQRYVVQASDEYVPYASVDGWDWKVKKLVSEYQAWIEQRYSDEKISYSVRCDRLRHSKQFLSCKLGELDVGDILVREITDGHFSKYFVDQLAEGRARKTVENIMGSMINLFEFAKISDCRTSNPARNISLKDIDKKKQPYKARKIHPDVIAKIMEQLDDTWKLMVFFAIATGVRQGEQRALVWGDIDFEGNKIWISKAVEHLTHKIKAPKTENGNRCIDLLPELKSQLQELYMRSGRPNDTELVFLIEGKAPCKQSFIRTMWRACEQAGVESIRWHDLRHFCASNLLQAYSDDKWYVSNFLGHYSPEITQTVYGHWLEEKDNSHRLDKLSGKFAKFAT